MQNQNITPVKTPHEMPLHISVTEAPGQKVEQIDVHRINLNLGHLATTGEFPNDSVYTSMKEKAYEATHDSLTGLLNRRGFDEVYKRKMEAAKDDPSAKYALIYLDLDGFKGVNDTHGHDTGDQLLTSTSRRWADAIHARKDDVLARLGGDEFVVLANVKQDPAVNKQRKVKRSS